MAFQEIAVVIEKNGTGVMTPDTVCKIAQKIYGYSGPFLRNDDIDEISRVSVLELKNMGFLRLREKL